MCVIVDGLIAKKIFNWSSHSCDCQLHGDELVKNIFICGANGIVNSMDNSKNVVTGGILDCLTLLVVNENSKSGVSEEGGNVPDPKSIVVE